MSKKTKEAAEEAERRLADKEKHETSDDPHAGLTPVELAALVKRR